MAKTLTIKVKVLQNEKRMLRVANDCQIIADVALMVLRGGNWIEKKRLSGIPVLNLTLQPAPDLKVPRALHQKYQIPHQCRSRSRLPPRRHRLMHRRMLFYKSYKLPIRF